MRLLRAGRFYSVVLEAADEVPPVQKSDAEIIPGSVSVLSAEAAVLYSLEDAWAWADRIKREAFVQQHRSELKKIIAKIERKKVAS